MALLCRAVLQGRVMFWAAQSKLALEQASHVACTVSSLHVGANYRATWSKGMFSPLSCVVPQPPHGATQVCTSDFAVANFSSPCKAAGPGSGGQDLACAAITSLISLLGWICLPDSPPPPRNAPVLPSYHPPRWSDSASWSGPKSSIHERRHVRDTPGLAHGTYAGPTIRIWIAHSVF